MHAQYYSRETGLGQRFESVVAAGLAEFSNRLNHSRNRIWTAMHEGEIIGSVAIDGEDLEPGIAHLRWFIVDDSVRGSGAGRRLLNAALEFVDQQKFRETQLWTFSGLSAARHLYESYGFKCVEEWVGDQWGNRCWSSDSPESAPAARTVFLIRACFGQAPWHLNCSRNHPHDRNGQL